MPRWPMLSLGECGGTALRANGDTSQPCPICKDDVDAPIRHFLLRMSSVRRA